MNLDGRRLSEDERMTFLIEEERYLGLWHEYPSNTLLSARLVVHPAQSASVAPEAASPPPVRPPPHVATPVSLRGEAGLLGPGEGAEVLT